MPARREFYRGQPRAAADESSQTRHVSDVECGAAPHNFRGHSVTMPDAHDRRARHVLGAGRTGAMVPGLVRKRTARLRGCNRGIRGQWKPL